jgi:N-acetylglucosamine kinase-like BadF-type ATPase
MLTNLLLEYTGAKDELELVEGFSNDQFHLAPFLAVEVARLAREGDAAALEVMHWAGEELGWLAVAVARQIDMEHEAVDVIQSGSVFDAGGIITEPMKAIVLKHCPKATLKRLEGAPVVGAVILGMEVAGFDGYPIRAEIIRTSKEIMA